MLYTIDLGSAGLAQVVTEVSAPDDMPAEAAVGKGDHIDRLVGQQGEGNNQRLIALAAGHSAPDQPLAKKIEDAVVAGLSMGGYVAFAMLRHAPRYAPRHAPRWRSRR